MSKDLIGGPWKWRRGLSELILDSDNLVVASVCGRTQHHADKRAALVAAAPQMLASMKQYLNQNGSGASVIEAREAMRRAVALAEGITQ